jgi:hypothetical protein
VPLGPLVHRFVFRDVRHKFLRDHHQNDTNVEDVTIFYSDPSFASAAEMIVDFIRTHKLRVTSEAATYLYGGMVTDTGRFMHLNNASKTFELASYIMKFNPSFHEFYNYIYTETLKKRQTKNLFSKFELTPNNVAYRKNDTDLIAESGLNFQAISRGMVTQMAGIKEVPIWANFTDNINLLAKMLKEEENICSEILYGDTPIDNNEEQSFIMTREKIIRTFNDSNSKLKVLIANQWASLLFHLKRWCRHPLKQIFQSYLLLLP